MEFGLVWFGLVSPFEATRVTSKVVEKAEGAENVISLPDQEQRASGYAHFSPGSIPIAYSGNTAPLPDERFDQMVPSTSIGEEGTTEPPAGSTLMPSCDGLGDPAKVKVTCPGFGPKMPIEIG
jgi:hypothetical protein